MPRLTGPKNQTKEYKRKANHRRLLWINKRRREYVALHGVRVSPISNYEEDDD